MKGPFTATLEMEGPFRIEAKPFVTDAVQEVSVEASPPDQESGEQRSRYRRVRTALHRFFTRD